MSSPVVLVTGANRGIGAAISLSLASAGFAVALTARNVADLRPIVERIEQMRGQVMTFALDVTDADAVGLVLPEVMQEMGRLDAVVNNAGIIEEEAMLWDSDPQGWWRVLEVNVRGAYLVARTASSLMLDHGGRIININSGAAGSDAGEITAYNASKAALSKVTAGVHAGYDRGLRAFDVAPGVVRTDMTLGMQRHAERSDWTDVSDVCELIVAIVDGRLDHVSGRMIRAGADSMESLQDASSWGEDARRLRWSPYGVDDPISG